MKRVEGRERLLTRGGYCRPRLPLLRVEVHVCATLDDAKDGVLRVLGHGVCLPYHGRLVPPGG